MHIHDHEPNLRGRAFLWGGIGAGVLFLALLLTHGFGLFSGSGKGASETPLLVRQGDKIIVPEGSALRSRLTVLPAPLQAVAAKLTLPAVVESDPTRTAARVAAPGRPRRRAQGGARRTGVAGTDSGADRFAGSRTGFATTTTRLPMR